MDSHREQFGEYMRQHQLSAERMQQLLYAHLMRAEQQRGQSVYYVPHAVHVPVPVHVPHQSTDIVQYAGGEEDHPLLHRAAERFKSRGHSPRSSRGRELPLTAWAPRLALQLPLLLSLLLSGQIPFQSLASLRGSFTTGWTRLPRDPKQRLSLEGELRRGLLQCPGALAKRIPTQCQLREGELPREPARRRPRSPQWLWFRNPRLARGAQLLLWHQLYCTQRTCLPGAALELQGPRR